MKRFIATLIVLGIIGTSQASTILTDGTQKVTVLPAKTAIRNVPGRVNSPPRIPKFKVLRANPHKVVHRIIDDSDDDFMDDDSVITSYRRRDLQKVPEPKDNNDELSENVRWRLFLARQMAMMKYKEKFGNEKFDLSENKVI